MQDAETRKREIEGLLEAPQATECKELTILTLKEEEELMEQHVTIHVIPVWKWMLHSMRA